MFGMVEPPYSGVGVVCRGQCLYVFFSVNFFWFFLFSVTGCGFPACGGNFCFSNFIFVYLYYTVLVTCTIRCCFCAPFRRVWLRGWTRSNMIVVDGILYTGQTILSSIGNQCTSTRPVSLIFCYVSYFLLCFALPNTTYHIIMFRTAKVTFTFCVDSATCVRNFKISAKSISKFHFCGVFF